MQLWKELRMELIVFIWMLMIWGYLVTGTGKTVEEAKACFIGGYEDMKDLYKMKALLLKRLSLNLCTTRLLSWSIIRKLSHLPDCLVLRV